MSISQRRPNLASLHPFTLTMALIVTTLAAAQFFLPAFQRTLVTELMIWAILAMAYDFLYGLTGLMSLGHAMFFGVGAYGVGFAIIYLGVDVFLAVGLALLGASLFSFLIGYLCIRVKHVSFIMVTLIFSMVFYLLTQFRGDITGGDDGLPLTLIPTQGGGFTFSLYDPAVNYGFVLVFFALTWMILHRIALSPVGRTLEAIRENEEHATLLGYNVNRYKLFAFTLSGIFSSLAGALFALTFRYTSAQLFFVTISINPLAWTLIGGPGTLLGPIIGAFLLVTVQDYLSALFPAYLILIGIVLIAVILRAPNGMLGTVKMRLRRLEAER